MLKILQARLQQYVNCEIPGVQAGFTICRGTRDQIANICWIIDKAREFKENFYFCFIDYAKTFDCEDHDKLWKILKEMELPDLLICLLRNLYAGQEATVRTGHGKTDWFQIGKGVLQSCILSPCLFNLYAEYIMWNARLDEAKAGLKISRRNINNLRFTDDTTLMVENEEELESERAFFLIIKDKYSSLLGKYLIDNEVTVSRSGNLSSNAYLFWLIPLQEVFWHYCCFLGRLPWDKTSLNSQQPKCSNLLNTHLFIQQTFAEHHHVKDSFISHCKFLNGILIYQWVFLGIWSCDSFSRASVFVKAEGLHFQNLKCSELFSGL